MNVRKSVDYIAMFAVLDTLMAADLPQTELYCGIGRLVSGRPEKGAAVAAAEYLCGAYPDASGFSPRNLRRMREFYRTYASAPKVLADAMTIGWTQNVVILEAELTLQERAWYIQAVRQSGWSKLELTRKIHEYAHRTVALDSTADSCYSNGGGGSEDGTEETSGALLQDLRDTEVQREFQRQGPRSAYMQSLFPPHAGAAGRADDAAPPERERDDLAEKSDARSPARGEILGLHGLCGTISPLGAELEKAGTFHPGFGVEHRWRDLRSLWRTCVCQRELPSQPNATSHYPHTGGWRISNSRASIQNPGEAVEVDGTHAGDFLVGRRLLQSCRCRSGGRNSLVERPCGVLQRRDPGYGISG